MLPLRQLLRRVSLLRRPLRLPSQAYALPADGPRGEARGPARSLALLLLRGVLRPVPARRRARRDDDEPAAVAHVALRLDGDIAPVLPLVALGAGAIVLVAVLTAIAFTLFGLSQGSLASYDGPNAFLPSSSIHIFDWALAVVLARVPAQQRGPHVVVHDGPRQVLAHERRQLPQQSLDAARPLLHASALQPVRSQGPLADPPRADAELRGHARADHVLPRGDGGRARASTGGSTCSAISPRPASWSPRSSSCATA